jgi:hypothetical protein
MFDRMMLNRMMLNHILFLFILVSQVVHGDLFIVYRNGTASVDGWNQVDIYYVDNVTGACNHAQSIVMNCRNCSNNLKLGNVSVTYGSTEHRYKVSTAYDSNDSVYEIYNPNSTLPSERFSDHFLNTIYSANGIDAAIVDPLNKSSANFSVVSKYGDILYAGTRRLIIPCFPNSTPYVDQYYLEDLTYLVENLVAQYDMISIDVPLAHIVTYFFQTCAAQKCPNGNLPVSTLAMAVAVTLIICLIIACFMPVYMVARKRW